MLPTELSSDATFESAFAGGLERMLEQPSLGSWILVLANAMMSKTLFDRLMPAATAGLVTLARQRDSGALNDAPPDDLAVFDSLRNTPLETFGLIEQQRIGRHWQAQFNPLRALRPPRNTGNPVQHIKLAFNPDGFHFNKPFLAQEMFWSGELGCRHTDLLYNKFPFAQAHALLVPEREREQQQYLDADTHAWAYELTRQTSEKIAGVGLAYNSLGASASVNHLHLQLFVEPPFAAENSNWAHMGGKSVYPADCCRFDGVEQGWRLIAREQRAGRPFNLIYRGDHGLFFRRRYQQDCPQASGSGSLAWIEMAGRLIFFDRGCYEKASAPLFGELLNRTKP